MGRLACAALWVIVTMGVASAGTITEIGPDTNWCVAANALSPGDELRLRPGEYRGSCALSATGTPDARIVIAGAPNAERPRIVYESNTDNVVNVHASFITLRHLQFGPTLDSVDAIRIRAGDGIIVEDCAFDGLGGAAVVAGGGSISQLTIRANEIVRSRATAVYLGCHGGECTVDAVFEDNYISGVTAPPAEVGYGIQVKLNSAAVIRDNVIRLTKGPGIMVYGNRDLSRVSLVESNFTAQSSKSAGIVVGGGPVIVRNNIAIGSAEAGIALEDYNNRGLLRGIVLSHNTVWGNVGGGIVVVSKNRVDARLLHNAVHRSAGGALPEQRPGLLSLGNVDCSAFPCFRSAAELDFTPVAGSILEHRALRTIDQWTPERDYFGNVRPPASAVGAVEAPGGVVNVDHRKLGPSAN
jgi:Right handed beta helix region